METITIKRTQKGIWLKKFDDYEKTFSRISKKEAINDIKLARKQKRLFADDNENNNKNNVLIFGYEN